MAALAQAAAAARPPSCSGSPLGALPRRGARSRAPAQPGRGTLPPRASKAGRNVGLVTRSPASPSQSNKTTPQQGPPVWGKPFFHPKLWGCGSPQSPWEWGRGRTGYYLIGFELISSSQITFPAAYHSASSCAITLPVLWVLEALRFPESPRKLPTPLREGTPKLLAAHACSRDSLAASTRSRAWGTGKYLGTGEEAGNVLISLPTLSLVPGMRWAHR